jgi:predicted amidohydrolase YtcJ
MQGVHCTSDAAFALKRLGLERAREGAYVWRSLLDANAVVINGTDASVERIDPIACFYASVTRKPAGAEPFFPEQRMTRQEALRSYTIDAAYAAFEEHIKGSITPGKLADITVLSHDILTVPEEEILKARVLYTVVGGKVLYKREE